MDMLEWLLKNDLIEYAGWFAAYLVWRNNQRNWDILVETLRNNTRILAVLSTKLGMGDDATVQVTQEFSNRG